uniref:Uncharacterized protein n=1 Tax=Arundo donax TaxID=35708 RepID=A0A0A9CZ31_ARUDO
MNMASIADQVLSSTSTLILTRQLSNHYNICTVYVLGQLALRLCFMSCKSGKRIAFTIDMTDLNRAVYPSEPSELLIKVCEAQTTLAQASIDETMVSVRNLQPGRTMILRLCRMVSQLIYPLAG